MAYDPLTGRYTPDPVAPSNFTYGQGNPLSNVYVPPAAVAPTRATPGQFRRAEDTSNKGAPAYTPTPLTETGEFATQPEPITTTTTTTLTDPYAQYLKDVKSQEGVSAYNLLLNEFTQYGLGALVSDIRELLVNNTPPSEMSLVLQKTPSYQARFSANKDRIAAGLRVLRPAEYIALEDQYQNVMRQYGLPASYYTKDDTGKQSGFDKFIAGDVSATELEDRIATAQKRVINANPEVSTALKQFYPDITNGDILAYTLDPTQAIEGIKRKVTAAEIQGAANVFGLNRITAESTPDQIKALEARAQALAGYGVTAQAAREGFQTVAAVAPRGSQLAEIYQTGPYGQAQVEEEVFKLGGAAESRKRREKLVSLETAQFSGTAGRAAGALGRERAMGQGQI
jgi:hypothetical protein